MSRWLDKLISELKWRSWYDYAWIQDKIAAIHKPPMPEPEEGVAVVEVEAVPVEEVEVSEENCPECGQTPCVCEEEKPESWEAEDTKSEWFSDWNSGGVEEPKLPEETEAKEECSAEECSPEECKLEETTPAEEDRMQEILNAIKTFFPNENTEDVLVRLVQKLIDR